MRTTSQIRAAWHPPCTPFPPRRVAEAYVALDACFRAWAYHVRSGETWGYACRPITGGSGYSLHAYGPAERFVFWTGVAVTRAVAVDVNSRTNPYGERLITDMPRSMIDAVLAIRTRGGHRVWGWGGNYRGVKDAMHFELIASPGELSEGIDPTTVPGQAPTGPPPEPIARTTMEGEPVVLMPLRIPLGAHGVGWAYAEVANHRILSIKVNGMNMEGKSGEATGRAIVCDSLAWGPSTSKVNARAVATSVAPAGGPGAIDVVLVVAG